jgi:hypothetical protein
MTHTIGEYTVEEVATEYHLLITAFIDGYVSDKRMRDDARFSLSSLLAYAMSDAENQGYDFARDNPDSPERDH